MSVHYSVSIDTKPPNTGATVSYSSPVLSNGTREVQQVGTYDYLDVSHGQKNISTFLGRFLMLYHEVREGHGKSGHNINAKMFSGRQSEQDFSGKPPCLRGHLPISCATEQNLEEIKSQ